jgi:hypothetical protein
MPIQPNYCLLLSFRRRSAVRFDHANKQSQDYAMWDFVRLPLNEPKISEIMKIQVTDGACHRHNYSGQNRVELDNLMLSASIPSPSRTESMTLTGNEIESETEKYCSDG